MEQDGWAARQRPGGEPTGWEQEGRVPPDWSLSGGVRGTLNTTAPGSRRHPARPGLSPVVRRREQKVMSSGSKEQRTLSTE